MSVQLRIILIAMSLIMLTYIINRIRKSKLKIEHSLFWVIVSLVIFILSIFPQIVIWVASICGVESPVNLLFLVFIFILLISSFYQTLKASKLENMLHNLTEEIAIREKMEKDEKDNDK